MEKSQEFVNILGERWDPEDGPYHFLVKENIDKEQSSKVIAELCAESNSHYTYFSVPVWVKTEKDYSLFQKKKKLDYLENELIELPKRIRLLKEEILKLNEEIQEEEN